jgi:hypothetical protein
MAVCVHDSPYEVGVTAVTASHISFFQNKEDISIGEIKFFQAHLLGVAGKNEELNA